MQQTLGLTASRVMLAMGIILILATYVVVPAFFSPVNLLQVARQASIGAIMAIGVTFVVMAGRMDLSVGSLLSLCAVTVVTVQNIYGPLPSIMAVIGIGLVAGAMNGYLVAVLRLNSLIATLGMLSLLQGIALVSSQGRNVPLIEKNTWFEVFGRGYFFGIPVPVLVVGALGLLFAALMRRTVFGRSLVAVGGNELAATFAAIDSRRVIFFAYVISGLLTAIAAIVFSSRVMAARNDSGSGYEILVLAAIILGGTSILGGSGGVWRSVFGVVVLAALQNIMILLGLPHYTQSLVTWAVVIAAVWFDIGSRRNAIFL
jgi:ribose transport system permease protein